MKPHRRRFHAPAILSGDLHSLQVLHSTLSDEGPTHVVQFIAGNGGTKHDTSDWALDQLRQLSPKCDDVATNPSYVTCPDRNFGAAQGYSGGFKATAHLRFEFGFMTAEKSEDGQKWLFRSRTLPSGGREIECEIPSAGSQPCGPRP